MKKLIIASIAAVVGLAVNAATVDWQVQITGGSASGAYAGYTAYLVNASAWDATTISDATFSDSSIVLDSAVFNAGSGKSSKTYTTLDTTNATNPRSVDVTSLSEGSQLNVYYVILNTNADPDTYYKWADTLTGRSETGDAATTANMTIANSTLSAATWTTVGGSSPIPEPTSGLLLVLGMAGLALRRCRRS